LLLQPPLYLRPRPLPQIGKQGRVPVIKQFEYNGKIVTFQLEEGEKIRGAAAGAMAVFKKQGKELLLAALLPYDRLPYPVKKYFHA